MPPHKDLLPLLVAVDYAAAPFKGEVVARRNKILGQTTYSITVTNAAGESASKDVVVPDAWMAEHRSHQDALASLARSFAGHTKTLRDNLAEVKKSTDTLAEFLVQPEPSFTSQLTPAEEIRRHLEAPECPDCAPLRTVWDAELHAYVCTNGDCDRIAYVPPDEPSQLSNKDEGEVQVPVVPATLPSLPTIGSIRPPVQFGYIPDTHSVWLEQGTSRIILDPSSATWSVKRNAPIDVSFGNGQKHFVSGPPGGEVTITLYLPHLPGDSTPGH